MKARPTHCLVRAGSRRFAIALAAALFAAQAAHATSATWNGTNDALWAGSANWSGTPAVVPGSGDTATFNNAGNGNTVIDLGAGVTIQQVTFDSGLAAAYTLGSGGVGTQTLTISGGGVTLNSNLANPEVINANLVLGTAAGNQTYTFTNNSAANSLTVVGGISSTTTGTKTLAVAASGAVLFSGALTNGSGTLALNKSGSGVLTLTGANAFSGVTNVATGSTIRSGADNVLADASTLQVSAGTIDLNGFNDTVNGSGGNAIYFYTTGGAYNLTNTVSTGSGTLTLGGNIGVDSDARTTVNTISGKLDLGGATRTVNNASYGGIGSTAQMTPLLISADISGAGAGLTSQSPNGGGIANALILAGNNSYTGTTTLNSGYVVANHANALGIGGNITFAGSGGTLQYTANSASTDWSTRFRNNTSKPIRLDTNGQTVALNGIIDSSNTQGLTKLGGGILVLAGANTYSGTTTVNEGILQSAASDVLPNASAVLVSGNAAGVTATLDLNGNNDTVGGLGFGGASATSGAAVITGAGTLTLNGNVSYDATNNPLGATLAGSLALGSATRTFMINNSTSAAVDLAISAAITGGAVGLTKDGAGTLALSGVNTYAGSTTVNANGGVLRFDTPASIAGSGRNITVNSGGAVALGYVPATTLQDDLLSRIVTTSAGAVTLTANTSESFDFSSAGNNFTALALGAAGNVTYGGTLTPNGTTYRLGGGGGTLVLSNPVSGAGNTLVVNGNVTLSTSSDFTGTTTINSGILQVSQGATTNVVDNGMIVFDHNDGQNQSGTISGTGGLTKSGSGQLTLSVPQAYTGTTTVNAGILLLAGGNHTLNVNKPLVVNGGALNLGSNRQYVGNFSGAGGSITGTGTLTTNLTSALTFAGALGDSVNLVKAGVSSGRILTLTGNSTTSGFVSVIGGDQPETQGPSYGGLTLKDSGRLSGATAINLSNSSLFIDNTGTTNDNDRINNSATVTLDGGRIIYTGRASTASAEAFGAVTTSSGMGTISATAGASGSAVVTLDSLVRNTGATLQLEGANLGTAGNNSRILVNSALSGNLSPVNGVIPGAFKGSGGGSNSPVGYVAGLGFAAVGTSGGFPTIYNGTLAAAAATDNVVGASAWVVKAGGQTINSMVQSGNITFAAGADTLTIGSGMICQNAQSIPLMGTALVRGQLTSGLSSGELFLIRTNEGSGGTAGALQISSVITDNGDPTSGGTRVKLVLDSYFRTNLTNQLFNLTATNTHTGGTVVSGGNETYLNSSGTAIPAAADPTQGLIINDSIVTMQVNAQQIAASNIVTLNGGSVLTLIGANNTLAGIVFNSNGGKGQTPTVQGGTKLTITGNIASTPNDVSVTPLISVTLDLNGSSAHDITVAALPEGTIVNSQTQLNGLTISSVIQNGGFTKKGGGILYLTGTNTYTGDTIVKEGILCVTKAYLADASSVMIGTAPGDTAMLKLDHGQTDTVARLYINGVQMPVGTYGSSASAATYKDNSVFAGTGVLNVTSGSPITDPYLLWAQANITDRNVSADATPGGDPDKDGSNNLAEFAFNGDPLSSASHGKVYVMLADSEDAGTARELILTIAVRANTPAFSADTSPTATSALDGITYTIEGSTELNGFPTKVNALVSPIIPAQDPNPGSGYVYRSFSLDGSDGLTGKGFMRAKVTRP